VAAVDQDGKLDPFRSAEVDQTVHGCTDCAAGKKDIVDEDNLFPVQRERDIRLSQSRFSVGGLQVVPVEGDVKDPERNLLAFDSGDLPAEALRKEDPPGPDSNQDQLLDPLVLFQDLLGDARQRTVDSFRIHDDLFLLHGSPLQNSVNQKKAFPRRVKACLPIFKAGNFSHEPSLFNLAGFN
jgi:hypothetical protein